MPCIDNPELGQPKEGNIQLIILKSLNDSPAVYLEIPILHLTSLCVHPRKYLRYLGWCIMGVDGSVARDSPPAQDNIGDIGELESGTVYSYSTPEDGNSLVRAINMDAINTRSASSIGSMDAEIAEEWRQFQETLEQRDLYCIMTGEPVTRASHIIPYAHENAWIDVITQSRLNYGEDVTGLTVNDPRNGTLVCHNIHALLETRAVAFLKTPNHVLNCEDLQINNNRMILQGTGHPEGERLTLQLIEPLDGNTRTLRVEANKIGCDAAFSTTTEIAKPSAVLLHYNYGAAAVKWWGHHTEILRSRGPPHPPSLPPPRRRRRHLDSPPVPGPSAAGEPLNRGSKRKRVDVADEPINELKVWESWDEDDWMLYFMLNTKTARERHQAAQEESSSNIKTWAQGVSGHQNTGI